ncbi:Quinol oxidase subunit 3 [Polystyrenella longa]|uniref:Quinol oxidase subunit 3 n=1 Tax=Polystyrenella longa TaxID=2528007 RepID=A0A518CNJ6_9PLAN|nr:cytochrome c oxidase subunit 3 family protein [Polystyrenella longa]QDU80797.1 Quinol oxidase subunit 3 [Polystyrenella longa]
MTTVATDPQSDHSDHHDHPAFLAHHFENPEQQYDSGKLGIWLFLVTEVLFFSGLFVAYIIYRYFNPEIFIYADDFLDVRLGFLNTIILLFSSLTMAWAVRNAQLNQKLGLIINLSLTLVCAFAFLGVKYVEYSHKFHDGLLPGKHFNPVVHHEGEDGHAADHGAEGSAAANETSEHESSEGIAEHPAEKPIPRNAGIFFSIYFCMTGLHGIHILFGIGFITWLLVRAVRGEFNDQYFGPVDYVGLYWHLVDLIWIYLFPLLYLIG